MNAARQLQVYDIDLIMSWTPHEYILLLEGAKRRTVDELERLSTLAVWTAKANNSKNITAKKLFDPVKAHKEIGKPESENNVQAKRMKNLSQALKGFTPQFVPKGGR
jgi:hypothetical protein